MCDFFQPTWCLSNRTDELQTQGHTRRDSKLLMNIYFKESDLDFVMKIQCEDSARLDALSSGNSL